MKAEAAQHRKQLSELLDRMKEVVVSRASKHWAQSLTLSVRGTMHSKLGYRLHVQLSQHSSPIYKKVPIPLKSNDIHFQSIQPKLFAQLPVQSPIKIQLDLSVQELPISRGFFLEEGLPELLRRRRSPFHSDGTVLEEASHPSGLLLLGKSGRPSSRRCRSWLS